jgi:hypothetical protein
MPKIALFLARAALGMLLLSAFSLGMLLLQNQLNPVPSQLFNPGYPQFLYQIGEDQWLTAIWVVAIAAGLLIATSTLLYLNTLAKAIANFSVGFLTFLLASWWLNGIPFDTLSRYGIVADKWMLFSPIVALALAMFAGVATAPLIWRRSGRLTQAWVFLTSGLGTFGLCWYCLVLSVLLLGVAD